MDLISLNLSSPPLPPQRGGGKRTLTPNNMQNVLGGTGVGGFAAAKIGRLTQDWSSISRSADQDLIIDLRRLRARARQLAINSPIASKFLQMLRTNIIGAHGIRLHFKIEKQRKRGEQTLDEKTNSVLDAAWRKWCRRQYCTVHGRYSLRDVLMQAATALGRDGEILVRRVYVPKSVNPFGFSLQLIDADQLDETYNQIGPRANPQVRMGVEVDDYQKPIAYHIFKGNPYEIGTGFGDRQRVPAEDIYHFFIPFRVGQTRGYPLLAPAMWDSKMLDGYFEAELVAARSGASLLASIEQDDANDEYTGDGESADGAQKLDVGYGTVLELPVGQKLNNQTPAHPTNAFGPFVERSLRMIASGMGVAYHELANDLAGVNYSSGRLGVLEERDYFKELQNMVIEALCRPIYEDWVKAAILNNAVDLPFDMDRYTDMDAVKFIPRRWSWVDPLKDSQAAIDQVQNGFATHEDILGEQGKDWEDVYEQLALEDKRAKELGLQLGTDIRGDELSEVDDSENPTAAPAGNNPEKEEQDPAPQKPAAKKRPSK